MTTYPDPDDNDADDAPTATDAGPGDRAGHAGHAGHADHAGDDGRGTSLPDPVTGRRGVGPAVDEPADDPGRVDTTVSQAGDPTAPPAVAGKRWGRVAGAFLLVLVAVVVWVLLS